MIKNFILQNPSFSKAENYLENDKKNQEKKFKSLHAHRLL